MVLHNGHMLNSVGVIHSRITTFPRPFSAASHSVNTADITKTWWLSLDDKLKDKLLIKDKRLYIFNQFLLDHPQTLVVTYEQLDYLLREKKSFKAWSEKIQDQWTLLNNIPEWLMGDADLRDLWINEFQDQLVSLRLEQNKTLQSNNKAREVFNASCEANNASLATYEDNLYKQSPVILIHKVTPSALPEADMLCLHELNKEERREKRKSLVNDYRLKLLRDHQSGELTTQQLIDLVK